MNSIIRPRRLRRNEAIREMVRENHLKASDFIYPLFIHEKDFKKIKNIFINALKKTEEVVNDSEQNSIVSVCFDLFTLK